jgi:hypothetical protein
MSVRGMNSKRTSCPWGDMYFIGEMSFSEVAFYTYDQCSKAESVQGEQCTVDELQYTINPIM